jgi:uncharacterized membrane protein YfcA
MSARDRIRGLFAGALTGIAGGLFGVGGGLVLVPMLTGFFRLTQHQAHGTSLAVIGATAITAILVYGAHANIAWSRAAFIALGSLVTARLGARWAVRLPAHTLRRAFAVFLALVAIRLLWQIPPVGARAMLSEQGELFASLLLGLAAGALAGVMGVGGGMLVVPALTLVFGLSQQAAQGTSLAAMVVTAPSAAFEHSRHGNVMWRLVPMLAVGAALGAPLASWSAQGLPHAWLVRAFALFILATAIHTWARTAGPARSPATGGRAR